VLALFFLGGASVARPSRTIPPAGGCTNPRHGSVTTATLKLPPGLTPRQVAAAYGVEGLWRAGFRGQGRRIGSTSSRPARLRPATRCTCGSWSASSPRLINAALDPRNTGGKRVDVITMSFGWCERALPRRFLRTAEAALRRAARLGVTVLAAAGDAGSLGTYQPRGGKPTCVLWPVRTNVARHLPNIRLGLFYPASSPYVTAVGGTELAIGVKAPRAGVPRGGPITDEVVWNQQAPPVPFDAFPGWPDLFLAGGGGRSILFDQIRSRRSLRKPDIAALAGRPYQLGESTGTSVASPMMAGALAVLDGSLVAHHAPPLGTLNALLYRIAADRTLYPEVFHDVIHGSNDLLHRGCCRARPGYDEASGLGSLDIGALGRVLLARRHSRPDGP
jgi:subtilisin family serine protease